MGILSRLFTRTPANDAAINGIMSPSNKESKRVKANEGHRPDLDKNFRSTMESNVYRYLVECHPSLKLVEFEPKWFTVDDGLPYGFKYCPDFRCTTHENYQFYIEVKGVWDKRSIYEQQMMHKFRPDVEIFIIDSPVYQKIKKKFAKRTLGWEH